VFGHSTYLIFELGWALPVLVLQWAVGWRTLWERRRPLVTTAIVATAYLSCTDGVAIANGIWTLHRDRIVGIQLLNVPIEDVIFFLLTNLMVVQSVLLVYRVPAHSLLSRLTPGKR
jgi:lycopene cyclase domain-containing protein